MTKQEVIEQLAEYKEVRKLERWKMIPSFTNYMASDQGRIRRRTPIKGGFLRCNRLLTRFLSQGRFWVSVTTCTGNSINKTVATLVAETFLGSRPENHDVHHSDGDSENDWLDNLRYVSHGDHVSLHRNNLV